MEISCIFFAEQHEQTAVAAMDPLHTLHGATRLLPNFFLGILCAWYYLSGEGRASFSIASEACGNT